MVGCICKLLLVDRPLHIHFDHELFDLPFKDIGFTAGANDQQGIFTSPRHRIPFLVYPGD